MSKHTRGPWTWCNGDGFSINRVMAKDTVAHVLGDSAEADANMKLIAAAPELLEICKHILAVCQGEKDEGPDETPNRLRAAIAKAEGK